MKRAADKRATDAADKRATDDLRRAIDRASALVGFVLLLPLRLYSRVISPALPPRCKYYPTCSAYAEQAVTELGVVRGVVLAAWRLARCNPWSHGGVDELGDRRLFRDATPRSERASAGRDGVAA